MANADNLIPNSQRTPSELREIASKGGKARAKKMKERKLLKELLEEALETKTDTGIVAVDIARALINQALTGNVKAFEVIRDTTDQKPKDKLGIELNPKATSVLESINKQIGGKK